MKGTLLTHCKKSIIANPLFRSFTHIVVVNWNIFIQRRQRRYCWMETIRCTIVALRRCIIHNTLHSIRMKMIIHQFSKYLFVFINLNNAVRFSNLYFKQTSSQTSQLGNLTMNDVMRNRNGSNGSCPKSIQICDKEFNAPVEFFP